MIILISALFMVFYISGFLTSMLLIKFMKKYFEKETIVNNTTIEEKPTNQVTEILDEWLHGTITGNGGDK